jgi:hypothetical protein
MFTKGGNYKSYAKKKPAMAVISTKNPAIPEAPRNPLCRALNQLWFSNREMLKQQHRAIKESVKNTVT